MGRRVRPDQTFTIRVQVGYLLMRVHTKAKKLIFLNFLDTKSDVVKAKVAYKRINWRVVAHKVHLPIGFM